VLVSSDAIKPPKGPYITIQVNGQQYIWHYTYLNYGTLADGSTTPTATTRWSCRPTRRS